MTTLHQIFPHPDAGPLDTGGLENLYDYPCGRTHVVVNLVASADGAVEVDGLSGGLSTEPDRRVLRLGTDLADAVLVGAGTAAAEGFRGARPHGERAERRRRFGRTTTPVTAVVSGSGRSLPPSSPVLTDTAVTTVVLTCAAVPVDLRERWADAGADVAVVGDTSVDLVAGLHELVRRGLRRINCMGGPALFGDLASAGLVDELRLTIAPFLVSGTADRIMRGAPLDEARLRLVSAVTGGDTLLLRYALPGRP